MATPKKPTAQRTAVMKKYQSLKAAGRSSDSAANTSQATGFRPSSIGQGGISNIRPGDVSFGTGSQSGQGSAYNMYPTGSYNTQFARLWDPIESNNQPTNNASNQIIGQFAQVERGLEPNISAYQDSAAKLNAKNKADLLASKNQYEAGNARMQEQSNNYYAGLGAYNQSQQGNQEAFAANEARRATGSQQAATAAGQRVGQTYVAQSLDAQKNKYAEDKALLNELTNYIKDYNVNIKSGNDQYDLGTQDKLLEIRTKLSNDLANQQLALIGTNAGFDLNEMAAQRAFIRQQALAAQQAALNRAAATGGTATTPVTPAGAISQINQTAAPATVTYTGIRSNADQSMLVQASDGKQYTLTAQQAAQLRSNGLLV